MTRSIGPRPPPDDDQRNAPDRGPTKDDKTDMRSKGEGDDGDRTNRRSGDSASCHALRARRDDRSPIGGYHQGPRPCSAATEGRTRDRIAKPFATSRKPLHQGGRPHMTTEFRSAFMRVPVSGAVICPAFGFLCVGCRSGSVGSENEPYGFCRLTPAAPSCRGVVPGRVDDGYQRHHEPERHD